MKIKHNKRGWEHVAWYEMLPYLKGGVVNLFFYRTLSFDITKNEQLSITYLTMAISTKINSTALSYLSIITNKTEEMIAMKILVCRGYNTVTPP